MPWINKTYLCDWCEEELNAIVDPVFESEKGTLCEKCEKGRVAEKEMYKESRNDVRLQKEIEKVQRELTQGESNDTPF